MSKGNCNPEQLRFVRTEPLLQPFDDRITIPSSVRVGRYVPCDFITSGASGAAPRHVRLFRTVH